MTAIPTEAMIEAAAKVLNERLAKEDGLFGVSRDMLSAALSSVPPAVPEEVETAHPTDNQVVAAVKAYISIEGKCRPAAMRSALAAALSAGQAQPVAIKPLEWEYAERKTMTYTAFWADGDVAYYINQSFGSDSYYFRTIRWPEETIYDGDDLPSAKAAAQKDYETRILSALEVSHAS